MADITSPCWDLSPIFPSMESPEFTAAMDKVRSGIAHLKQLFDKHGLGRREDPAVDNATASLYDEVTTAINDVSDQFRALSTYVNCIATTDATDDLAKSNES